MTGTKVFRKKNDEAIFETWFPVLENYGVKEGNINREWLAEYSHNHASWDNAGYGQQLLTEAATPGLFFQKPGSISAMGSPIAPTPGQVPFPGGAKGTSADSGSGDKFPSLLPVAIQIAAKTVAFDLISVIPMDAPVGFIPYLDYVYAGGKTDTEFPPFLIKFTGFDPTSVPDAGAAANLGAIAVGTAFTVENATPATTINLKLVGFSRVDGSAVFRVLGLTDLATTVVAAVQNGFTLEDGTNTWDIDSAAKASVDLVSALENHISGFTSTDNTMSDNWNGPYLPDMNAGSMDVPGSMSREQGENALFRQMGLKMFTKFVEADIDQVAISATIEQIQDFNRVWNFDVISMLENVAVNDVAQSINKRLSARVHELGYIHTQEIAKVEGPGLTTLSLAAGGGFENTSTLQRRVVTKVLEMANLILHRSRWGAGEYVVTNGRVASAIADIQGYSLATAPVNAPAKAGQLYPMGDVYGLKIYVDPNLKWGDNKITIGRKGSDEEPGVKFLPYIMAESLQTISEGTFSPKIGVKSRYAITEAGWHPETQYITMEVSGIEKIVAGGPAVP